MVSFRTSCQTKKHSFVQNKNRFPKGGDFFLFKHFFDDKSYEKDDDRDDGSDDYKFHDFYFEDNPNRFK
jgi:hypothetical protein